MGSFVVFSLLMGKEPNNRRSQSTERMLHYNRPSSPFDQSGCLHFKVAADSAAPSQRHTINTPCRATWPLSRKSMLLLLRNKSRIRSWIKFVHMCILNLISVWGSEIRRVMSNKYILCYWNIVIYYGYYGYGLSKINCAIVISYVIPIIIIFSKFCHGIFPILYYC